MRDSSFYDKVYFDGPGKSNYSGYTFESSPFVPIRSLSHGHQAFDLSGPVLDVGCAKGYLVYVLRQRGIKAFGVDCSKVCTCEREPRCSTLPMACIGGTTAICQPNILPYRHL